MSGSFIAGAKISLAGKFMITGVFAPFLPQNSKTETQVTLLLQQVPQATVS